MVSIIRKLFEYGFTEWMKFSFTSSGTETSEIKIRKT